MNSIDIVQLAVEIVILLLLLYLAFLKSYFQEKGKNLATKEDIEEITSMVESVKSQVQFSLQAKLSLRTEEHEALMGYYSQYHAWLAAITNCSTVGVSYENSSRLSEIRSELEKIRLDFDLAAGKMELLVEKQEIILQHGELNIKTIEFQNHATQSTFHFQGIYLEIEKMKLDTPQDEQLEKHKALLARETELFRKFKEEQLEMYKALHPLKISDFEPFERPCKWKRCDVRRAT